MPDLRRARWATQTGLYVSGLWGLGRETSGQLQMSAVWSNGWRTPVKLSLPEV